MILSSSLINREFRATAVYLCIFYHSRHLMHKKSIAGLAGLCYNIGRWRAYSGVCKRPAPPSNVKGEKGRPLTWGNRLLIRRLFSCSNKTQLSWHKPSLKNQFKHACKIKFVWYNSIEDGGECTDSAPPSQYVPLSPSGIPTPLSPFIFTLSRKRAA